MGAGVPSRRRPLVHLLHGKCFWGNDRWSNAVNATATIPNGAHTLTVRVTGDKNPASSNTVISLDRIEVY
ncbi:hypothetical protein AB0E63_16790 [Kribbella sp. NPDC026596]|uniref:hypothetical protein n=1 Tax=Kribbella sp. NPDC026596 TaxID=3155122 RepID=UPI0033CD100B